MTTLILATVALFLLSPASAHPGNTDSSGCHTCYTNCESYGLDYYEYHCHTPKIQAAPVCPLFATYDYGQQTCKCNYGYYASGGSCISYQQTCVNQLGPSSVYNAFENVCKCLGGTIIDPGTGKCTSAVFYCSNKYGTGSVWNFLEENCSCASGYEWGANGTCVYQTLDTSQSDDSYVETLDQTETTNNPNLEFDNENAEKDSSESAVNVYSPPTLGDLAPYGLLGLTTVVGGLWLLKKD